ncbi:GNAT family N-acetyltransferase [Streptomyces sp. NPDC007088]|uniref:GNAT family N-acetyltransferase n=1 Tax=Streptomyces sp. NPDC007088 TaxID=3364773 RepID=UPI00368ED35C
MADSVARVLDAVARGVFPVPDGSTTVLPQSGRREAGVLAFTAHSVVFVDEDPAWVRRTLAGLDCDPLAASLHPSFLGALTERTGRHMDTVDLLTVAGALPGPPPLPLREVTGTDHPRVARALRRRDGVRVWAADGGLLVLGRGLAGRWEAAIEVAEPVGAGHRPGLGRALAGAARHLVPEGAVVWAQQAPGNARSVRAFQAAGYRPVGAEVLLWR